MRLAFLDAKVFDSIEDAQAQLDVWVRYYNFERPHQSLGMAVPWDRFKLANIEPTASVSAEPDADPDAAMAPSATRRVGRNGTISFASSTYKVGAWLAGQDVHVV